MKSKIIIIVLILLSAAFSQQSRNVSFIHGLGGNTATWYNTANELYSQYYIYPHNVAYDSYANISTTASTYSQNISTNSVAVAYSLGGLLSREIVRTQGTNKISALITVGTPHKGAPIINNAIYADELIVLWVSDLVEGWYYMGYPISTAIDIAYAILSVGYVSNLDTYINEHFIQGATSVQQMKPNSSFLNTLNQNPGNTFPSQRYAIYGHEDWNVPWRLGDSFFSNNNIETGTAIMWNNYFRSIYYVFDLFAFDLAMYYLNEFYRTWNYQYLELCVFYMNISNGFHVGYLSLTYWQEYDWDYVMTNTLLYENGVWTRYKSDGLLSAKTQIYYGYLPQEKYIQALHCNHLEEIDHTNGKNAIRNAFIKQDIAIQQR